MWIQEGFTAEPPRNDSGANFHLNDSDFGPKVRVTDEKSELQAKSQSYSRADPQNPNRIAQKRDPNGVQVLLQKTPLKAFLNPDKLGVVLPHLLGDIFRAISSQSSSILVDFSLIALEALVSFNHTFQSN